MEEKNARSTRNVKRTKKHKRNPEVESFDRVVDFKIRARIDRETKTFA